MSRHSSRSQSVRRVLLLTILLVCATVLLAAQGGTALDQTVAEIQQLALQQRWQEIIDRLAPLSARSAELDFHLGEALARMERWEEASSAFRNGAELAPHDPRFPTELAGVAFKQKSYPRAAHYLRATLRLNPGDSYANDFLGTVYFLEGNLEAALKYWNRVRKPTIAEVSADPLPRVDPALLDHAFAFAPASTLQLPQLQATEERVRGLGIFPRYQFDLRANDDGRFDVVFRNQERNGFGRTKLEALFLFFRGLPFLSVRPEFYNFRRQSMNFLGLVRWDPEKRRVSAELSSPFEYSAKYRYRVAMDLRNENWDVTDSFTEPAQTLGSLNLRREAASFTLLSFASGTWQWTAGAEVSHRDFRSVAAGTVLTPQLLSEGYQLKQTMQVEATIWRVPERRFTVQSGASSQAGRLWADVPESFEMLQGWLGWHWFPRSEGDDYEMQQQFRGGRTFGDVPFDELFMLGLERDNDLLMRAHIGTRDGRKGSAPLGRNYFVSNWEVDKNIYSNGLVTLKLGPFLDVGKIGDPHPGLGSRLWLWDTGAQIKLRVFGTGVAFSYGKDLRSGNNAFYLRMLP